MFLILLVFVGIPLIELYFLIEIGARIGALPTVFLTVFTAVLGGLLVRAQGVSTALRVQKVLTRGELPAVEMLEGAVLLAAGVVLLLPGFFTDAVGFLLLIPSLRRALILYLLRRSRIMRPPPPNHRAAGRSSETPRIIDGEYRREDD
ncbi:MAG TPA: FxsA family protein [Chromatiales bacterium]|nr:FxsA family protein [Chromatiales bacterium]